MRQKALKDERFKVKMDWWVLVGAVITVGLTALMIPGLFFLTNMATLPALIASLVLVAFTAYYIDSYFYRVYILKRDGLLIAGHLFSFFFPYRQMRSVAPGGLRFMFTRGGIISRKRHKRFALSRSNVVITFTTKSQYWTSVSLSPVAPEAFIRAILDRVDRERSSRVSTDASEDESDS